MLADKKKFNFLWQSEISKNSQNSQILASELCNYVKLCA